MAGRLTEPDVDNFNFDPEDDQRFTVVLKWAPDLAADNQGTLQSDGTTLANNEDGMARARLRWVYSTQPVAPDAGEIIGGNHQNLTILGAMGSVADDADDDSNDTSGDPGGPTPQTDPNNDWNEVSINSRTYFYRDEVYRLNGEPSHTDGSDTEIVLPTVWSNTITPAVSVVGADQFIAELVVDRRSDTSRVWKAIASTASANRPPDSNASNTHWEHIYTAQNEREIRSGAVADGLWDQRPDGDSTDMDYAWEETVALVAMKHADLASKWLWVYARCEVE